MVLTRGDQVRVTPEGPILCVEGVFSNRRVTCTWMDEMGQRHEGTFLRDSLHKIEPMSLVDVARKLQPDARAEFPRRRAGGATSRRRFAPVALTNMWRGLVARVSRTPA